jgi:GR25 family glycosyltransferase involved in LPS biosynthesis
MIKQIFVINLDKDKERRKNIEDNFRKYNLKYEIVSAVYGKDLSEETIKENTTVLCRNLLCNKSIIGSGMSHIKIWKLIAQKEPGWYMVCEDDINFTDDSLRHLRTINSKMQNREMEPIIINLNSCSAYNFQYSKEIIQENKLICGIASYIITPEAARRLIFYIDQNKINNYIDLQISFCNCGIKHYATPFPVVSDSLYGGYKTSNNMSYSYSVPLLQYLIELCLPYNWSSIINFRINLMAFCFMMKYCFSVGQFVILILILANIIMKNTYLWCYILIEIFLFIILQIKL